MSYETRSRNPYYYHKTRVNGRVTSEYIGTADAAAAWLSDRVPETERRWKQRQKSRDLRAHLTQLEQPFTELDAVIGDLTRAALITGGCHTHKGQWRRKRAKTIT